MTKNKIDSNQLDVSISNNRSVMLCPTTSISLFIDYEEIREMKLHCNDAFRELISRNEDIIEFKDGFKFYLNDSDLEIIAAELLKNNGIEQFDAKISRELYIDYLEKEYEKLAKSISISLAPVIQRLNEWQKPLLESISKLSEAFSRSPIFATLTNHANSKMKSVFVESLNEFMIKHNEIMSSIDKATLIALKYDWFISHNVLRNDKLFNDILELGRKGVSQQEFDSIFTGYFDETRISRMIDQIVDHHDGKKFKDILNEIKIGYNEKLYYLVIPAALSVLEGIVASYKKHTGRMKQKKYETFLNEILDRKSFHGIKDLVLIRVLAQFEHGQEIETPLSRHAILHGADSKYGTQENCIRCVLIINEIVYAMNTKEQQISS